MWIWWFTDADLVSGENFSIYSRVKELGKEVDQRARESNAKSCELRNKLEKCLRLRKLESQAEKVRFPT